MSEENAPKLRLKPKLATDPSTAQPVAPASAEPPPPSAQPVEEAPKLVRLKPKLNPAPVQEAAAAPAEAPAPVPDSTSVTEEPVRLKPRLSLASEETAAPQPAPAPEAVAPEPETPPPAAEPAKPVFKLGLKAKTATASPTPAPMPAPEAPAAAEGDAPPVLDAPPPPPREVETDHGEKGEPAEITAMRKATAAPFPPPGKFPPPPGLKKALDEASAEVTKGAHGKSGSKKKLVVLGAGVAAVLVLGIGGFVAFQKFTEEPPPPPKLVANPVTAQGQAVAKAKLVVDQAKEQAAAPGDEILGGEAKPAEIKPAEPAAVVADAAPKPAEEVKPAVPPPPPPPTVAFRGWVENLKISGVRGGANPRIFVGGSSYQPGDLINPQLGITFVGYNDAARMLSFQDKTGAKVERRN